MKHRRRRSRRKQHTTLTSQRYYGNGAKRAPVRDRRAACAASGNGRGGLAGMNWFVALKGSVRPLASGDGSSMAVAHLRQAYRAAAGPGADTWIASSPHVVAVAGFGGTPDAAIRDFEERMKLPAMPGGAAV